MSEKKTAERLVNWFEDAHSEMLHAESMEETDRLLREVAKARAALLAAIGERDALERKLAVATSKSFSGRTQFCADCEERQRRINEMVAVIGLIQSDAFVPCEYCHGSGHHGRGKSGKYVSCEHCGGHEDALGTGVCMSAELLNALDAVDGHKKESP